MGGVRKHFVIAGQQFDRLTVTDPETHKWGKPAALCTCSCGTAAVLVTLQHLIDGRVRSCGCIRREQLSTRNRATASRGGATKHSLWPHWAAMMNRCYNPAAGNYRWYGGEGIEVCDEWRNDPWAFFRYVELELGPRPSPKHSIDREKGENYAPGKIRWATPAEQARNRDYRIPEAARRAARGQQPPS